MKNWPKRTKPCSQVLPTTMERLFMASAIDRGNCGVFPKPGNIVNTKGEIENGDDEDDEDEDD